MNVAQRFREVFRSFEQALSSKTGWSGHCLRAASLLLPLGLFVLIAFGDPPVELALEVRYKNPIIVLGLGLFLYLAFRVTGWAGVLAGMGAVLSVFALELAGLWLAAESDGDLIIGGLLPWSDASQYYAAAQLLQEGGQLSPWHGRRPWFMGLLAVLLDITGGNLQWAVAALVVITGGACFLFARLVQAVHGSVAAAASLLVLLLFYDRFIGITMSEHLGLSLGMIALALLWQSAQQERLNIYWVLGLGLLTCALLARAGAFFVLPALLAWGVWQSYRAHSAKESFKTLTLGGGAIGAGFMMDAMLRRTLIPEALPSGNFSYVLYGLVTGNKGWLQIQHDHPEIMALSESDAARYAYDLAFAALRDGPASAVSGALGAWRDFFSFGSHGALGFIPMPEVQWAAIVLCSLGLVACMWRWRSASHSMILAMTLGVLLSVPFVPPVDAHSMRAYAATIPLCALLVALGAALLIRQRPVIAGTAHLGAYQGTTAVLGTFVVMAAFFGSMAPRQNGQAATFYAPCPPGHVRVAVYMTAGSSIRLVSDDSMPQTRVPNIRFSDFKAGLRAYRSTYPELYAELDKLQPGQELRYAINLANRRPGGPIWIVNIMQNTRDAGTMNACATLSSTKSGNFYRVQQEIQDSSDSP